MQYYVFDPAEQTVHVFKNKTLLFEFLNGPEVMVDEVDDMTVVLGTRIGLDVEMKVVAK